MAKLCTCNNCGNVYIDTNPGDNSIDYDNSKLPELGIDELPVIHMDEDGQTYTGSGCPVCGTDEYLVDNINESAGGVAAEIFPLILKG